MAERGRDIGDLLVNAFRGEIREVKFEDLAGDLIRGAQPTDSRLRNPMEFFLLSSLASAFRTQVLPPPAPMEPHPGPTSVHPMPPVVVNAVGAADHAHPTSGVVPKKASKHGRSTKK